MEITPSKESPGWYVAKMSDRKGKPLAFLFFPEEGQGVAEASLIQLRKILSYRSPTFYPFEPCDEVMEMLEGEKS